jgi:hypothetical protein
MKSIKHKVYKVLHKGLKGINYMVLTLCFLCLLYILCG